MATEAIKTPKPVPVELMAAMMRKANSTAMTVDRRIQFTISILRPSFVQ